VPEHVCQKHSIVPTNHVRKWKREIERKINSRARNDLENRVIYSPGKLMLFPTARSYELYKPRAFYLRCVRAIPPQLKVFNSAVQFSESRNIIRHHRAFRYVNPARAKSRNCHTYVPPSNADGLMITFRMR